LKYRSDNDIHRNDKKTATPSIKTFRLMTSRVVLSVVHTVCPVVYIVMLSVILLRVIMLRAYT
jgi:hypothetical protein